MDNTETRTIQGTAALLLLYPYHYERSLHGHQNSFENENSLKNLLSSGYSSYVVSAVRLLLQAKGFPTAV